MKKIIITISLVFLFSILISSSINAYYRDAFWECTANGEQSQGDAFGRLSTSLQPDGICKKSCCVLCVSRSPIRDCFGGNAKPMCICAQASSSDVDAPVLTLNSPVQDSIYEKRAVDVNAQISELVTLHWLDNNHPERGYKRLCSKCSLFNRKISFQEGSNDITFRATDRGDNVDEERMQFQIDSKKPRISRAAPRNKKYGNSNFEISYSEENLKSLTIYYRTPEQIEYQSLSTNNCPSGRRESCNINIPGLQDGDLYYYPEIEDIALRKAAFREQLITIDTISPELTLDSSLSGNDLTFQRRLPLKLSVSEKVTLTYEDLNDPRAREKTICRRCDSFDRLLTFRLGTHNLKITATDNAGNKDEQNLVFTIIK